MTTTPVAGESYIVAVGQEMPGVANPGPEV